MAFGELEAWRRERIKKQGSSFTVVIKLTGNCALRIVRIVSRKV